MPRNTPRLSLAWRHGRQRGQQEVAVTKRNPVRTARRIALPERASEQERVGESPRARRGVPHGSPEPCTARRGVARRGVALVSVPRCTSRESRTDRTATAPCSDYRRPHGFGPIPSAPQWAWLGISIYHTYLDITVTSSWWSEREKGFLRFYPAPRDIYKHIYIHGY